MSVVHDLYATAIPHLLWRGEVAESIRELRLVREFARKRGIAPRHTAWTRGFELEGLIVLDQGAAAWGVVQAHLRDGYPRLAAKPLVQRVGRMPHFIRYWEIPAAYFAGRLKHAIEAMEVYLEWGLLHVDAYELRDDIYNGDDPPSRFNLARVTLAQLYREVGWTLADWPRWKAWVGRLHPGLLKLCELKAAELAADPNLMKTFHERLRVAERERRTAFVTSGQKDLLEPKRKVLARQNEARKRFHQEPTAHAKMLAEKRASYFPWLESKRADSESDARKARDLSIECMKLVGRTVPPIKQSSEESFYLRYRSACGQLMGEFTSIINRAGYDFPPLKPSEEEWHRVEARVPDFKDSAPGWSGLVQARRDLRAVRVRVAQIQKTTPRMTGQPGVLDAAIDRFSRALRTVF